MSCFALSECGDFFTFRVDSVVEEFVVVLEGRRERFPFSKTSETGLATSTASELLRKFPKYDWWGIDCARSRIIGDDGFGEETPFVNFWGSVL